MAAAAGAPILQTVAQALTACGVQNDNNLVFNGETVDVRISNEIFNDSFDTFIDKTSKDLDDDWSTYAGLTQAQGQIRLRPLTKKNIKGLLQWVKDRLRTGIDPATEVFTTANNAVPELIRRSLTFDNWHSKAAEKAKTAKPKQFETSTKWRDWKDSFENFLRTQPGRNGIPLSYVIRDNENPVMTNNNAQFLDDYVDRAPLTGDAYASDASEVQTYIVNFITENPVAENKILPYIQQNNGRVSYKALMDHYEGVGASAIALVKAENDIRNLFYAGEKKPNMWWDEFETRMTVAYATVDRHEGRAVYSDEAKLRALQSKIKADFLEAVRTGIELELAKAPITITYDTALAAYRNAVNRKHPQDEGRRTTRRIQETNRHGRGRAGRGRGNGRGRGGGRGQRRSRNDAWFIETTEGRRMEVHPSYNFSPQQWSVIPQSEKDRLLEMRREYKRQRQASSSTTASGYSRGTNMLPQGPPTTIDTNNNNNNNDSRSVASGITDGRTIMGGRSEQANLRSNQQSGNNRSTSVVTTTRNQVSNVKKGSEKEPSPNTVAYNESDSNADTCCLGTNFIPLSYTNRTADVYPYDASYKPITNVPIVTGATALDHSDGKTYILVINEGLYYGTKLPHSLINPNQIRHHGLDFWDNPYDKEHDLSIDASDELLIPMQYRGTKLCFKTRVPTREELSSCEHIHLTSDAPWEPHTVNLGKAGVEYEVEATDPMEISQDIYHGMSDSILNGIEPSLVSMHERIISQAAVNDDNVENIPARRTFVSNERHRKLSAEVLSELWFIGPRRAKETLQVTTQNGIRSAILPLTRRYRSDRMYNVKRLNGRFATDTFYSKTKSLHGNKCAQIYSHKSGFAVCYPMIDAKGETVGQTLADFVHDYGAPGHLTFDGATVQTGKHTSFQANLRHYNIDYHVSAPRRPNENPGEAAIREVKTRMYRVAHMKQVPSRVWDYLLIWTCETGSLTSSGSRYSNGRTPLEFVTGETPDISEYLDFGFYDWVTYRTNAGLGERSIGRWLGVSHKVGQLMSYWILTVSGKVISCVTVQRMTNAELNTDDIKVQLASFDQHIKEKFDVKDIDLSAEVSEVPEWNRLSIDENDPEFTKAFTETISDDSVPEADAEQARQEQEDYTPEIFDHYVNMELGLPRGNDGELYHAVVKRRAVDDNGKPVGKRDDNPILDTRQYEVEFLDGTTEVLMANTIAENILSQVDEEGHRQLLMSEIIDHRRYDDAISQEDGFYQMSNGKRRRKQTTKGWDLCVEWKDGSQTWVALKDLKNSYPVQLADYAIKNQIVEEPAFAWWVPHTIKKKKQILSKVKSKYWQRTHKYGIRVPKSVEEALEIDAENGNNLWRDSIEEEMRKIRDAFELCEGKPDALRGYERITTHFIFDIKLGENFRRKSRLVADGHKTKPSKSVTYSSVVARDSVRICLLLAALNELDIQAADIENAYLTAPCRERVWTIGGKEFGPDAGKPFKVVKALYGLKSSGAAFRAHLAERLDEIGFKSSIADPDVWLRAAVKPDGEKYYEYILVYVDDLLCISHDPVPTMKAISQTLKFKKDLIAPPEFYLGAKLEQKELNGVKMWTMTSRDYVKAAISNLEEQLKKKGEKLLSKAPTPMASNYQPETDGSPELTSDDVTTFQELIGILRWAIEIGRVDILTEVSMLSAYQASPRRGHLEQVYHIFAYLKHKPKTTLYFDPNPPILDPSWSQGDSPDVFLDQYRDAEEQLPPPHMLPKPLGRSIVTTAFVDASHAANKVTRRSHTGFIIFLNRAPIIWFSKRQNTVESSTFSSEFIAMRTCIEYITALRYKLRMFGVPVDESTKVLCDNESVVRNSSRLDSSLNKKHCALAYHSVRWAVAAGIVVIGWIPTAFNLADAMTKRLTAQARESLFGSWTY